MRLFPFKIGYILKELLNISLMVFINIDWRYDIVSIKQYDIDIMKPRSFWVCHYMCMYVFQKNHR